MLGAGAVQTGGAHRVACVRRFWRVPECESAIRRRRVTRAAAWECMVRATVWYYCTREGLTL